MGERSLLERAKGGEADAIAVLMNRSLQHQGVTVQVQRQADDLCLLLEAPQVPDRHSTMSFVQQELTRLNIDSLTQINLFGRRRGDKRATWRECFQLASPLPSSTPTQPSPPPTLEQRSHEASIPQNLLSVSNKTAIASPPMQSTHRKFQGQFVPQRALEISQAGWRALTIGWVLAMVLLSSGRLTFIFYPFITLVHELGHAACGWLMGYPAIPAFDFVHGGGVTSHFGRLWGLTVGIYIGFGYIYYRYRKNNLTLRCLLGAIALYSLIAFTPIHKSIVTMMGHGFELLFVGVFLYRALSGESCHHPLERSLYAMLAFFTWVYDIRFAYGLIFNWQARAEYLQGKGELAHDLTLLANQYTGGDLSVIAAGFLAGCLLTPVITLVIYRNRGQIHCLLDRLFRVLDDSQFRRARKAPSRYSGGG